MDDWNDFGPEPVTAESTSSTSFASFRSSQAAEPRSVLLPARPTRSSASRRRPPPSDPSPSLSDVAPSSCMHSASLISEDGPLGSAGDLDPATDCEDIGLSYRSLGSSDRYHNVSYTKLEVVSGQQIQQLLHAFHIVVAIGFCWTLFSVIILNALYVQPYELSIISALLSEEQKRYSEENFGLIDPLGIQPDKISQYTWKFRLENPSTWFRNLHSFVDTVCGAVVLVLVTLFAIRLSRTGRRNLSQEQLFAGGILFIIIPFFRIPADCTNIYRLIARANEAGWFADIQDVFIYFSMVAVGPLLLFFVWATIHSYRILDPSQKLGLRFYLPKILMVIAYCALKFFPFALLNLLVSSWPLITFVVMQHHFSNFNMARAYPKQFACVIVLTIFELAVIAVIVWEAAVTMRHLRKAPYMKHRTKHTGFRFFMYINFVFFISCFLMAVILAVGRPTGNFFITARLSVYPFFVPEYHQVGTHLLILGFATIWAFVNLPHDSIGAIKGWFKSTDLPPSTMRFSDASSTESSLESENASGSGSMSSTSRFVREAPTPQFTVDTDKDLQQEIVSPITYRKRETSQDSDQSLQLKVNCFTMQTHVIMFNFAWYAYYVGSRKESGLLRQRGVVPFEFRIADSIHEETTDSRALVIDGADRIVVAFKGTTSLRNLRTSIQLYHERLVNVVPTNFDGKDELRRLRNMFGGYYEAAKIHKGFASAYASIAHRVLNSVKKLWDERRRPLFLTGHSLGGALATVCSLDLWIKLDGISRRDIFVSTFGSPRVGNEAFRRVYDNVIVQHWRIVVDPDMVAKLPKGKYSHVGKKVLLTPHGQMFIDSTALELKLWSGSTSLLAYHRKASYLLAMQSWCVRHHKLTYTPAFWPFPVREDDRQRFEGADPTVNEQLSMSSVAKKIVVRDTMVDALDDPTVDTQAVEQWARLTRRLLLRHKLETAVGAV